MPEGYEAAAESIERYKTSFVWQNENGNFIEFRQSTLGTTITIDYEETELISYDTDDIQFLLKEKYGKKTYIWNTNFFCILRMIFQQRTV